MTELFNRTPLPLITSSSSCACCAPTQSTAADAADVVATEAADATGVTTVLQVTGMTCGHCVASVTEELGALAGVSSVEVDLVPGGSSAVSVTSATELDPRAVEAAVEEAGYTLVPSGR